MCYPALASVMGCCAKREGLSDCFRRGEQLIELLMHRAHCLTAHGLAHCSNRICFFNQKSPTQDLTKLAPKFLNWSGSFPIIRHKWGNNFLFFSFFSVCVFSVVAKGLRGRPFSPLPLPLFCLSLSLLGLCLSLSASATDFLSLSLSFFSLWHIFSLATLFLCHLRRGQIGCQKWHSNLDTSCLRVQPHGILSAIQVFFAILKICQWWIVVQHPPPQNPCCSGVTFIYGALALTSAAFAMVAGFKYNSVTVFNRSIRTENISNTLWILFYLLTSMRGAINAVKYALDNEKESSLDNYFFYTSIILRGLTAFALSLALNHQRRYRSSSTAPLSDVPSSNNIQHCALFVQSLNSCLFSHFCCILSSSSSSLSLSLSLLQHRLCRLHALMEQKVSLRSFKVL